MFHQEQASIELGSAEIGSLRCMNEMLRRKSYAQKMRELTDKRFREQLIAVKKQYRGKFSNGDTALMCFLTNPYVTERSPGQPFTGFLMLYFMKRALQTAECKNRSSREYGTLMRYFRHVADGPGINDNIFAPRRTPLERLADRCISKLEL